MSRRAASPLDPLGLNPVAAALRLAREWPTSSQQGARRNAMFATTRLMHRKVEREAVNDFLAELHAPPQSAAEDPTADATRG